MKAKINLKNIIAYVQGKLRYKLYYSKYKWLIRKHIREQIDFRIKYMNKVCFLSGSCEICGCETTALQMADKACDNPCYPKIMSKYYWKIFKKGMSIFQTEYTWRLWNKELYRTCNTTKGRHVTVLKINNHV